MSEKCQFQLFVRWNMGGEGCDVVELVKRENGLIMLSTEISQNRDRVYGFCQGLVEALNLFGFLTNDSNWKVEMPRCLTQRGVVARHLRADTSRQD